MVKEVWKISRTKFKQALKKGCLLNCLYRYVYAYYDKYKIYRLQKIALLQSKLFSMLSIETEILLKLCVSLALSF